ncbi:MAG: alpha/beta fold hydrolase [Gammaproteobacteria bacterium]
MHYVLVHGGNIDARCWRPLLPLLAPAALAVTLPGRPGNEADHAGARFDAWADSVIADMDAAGVRSAVLVGHSMGGGTLLAAARRHPHRIARLVFVACPIPRDGGRLVDALSPQARANIEAAAAAGEVTLRAPRATSRQVAIAQRLSTRAPVAEALPPFLEPVDLAGLRRGIPCHYVRLARDEAILPAMQDAYIARVRTCCPCEVIDLDADHLVMVTRPRLLAQALAALPAPG